MISVGFFVDLINSLRFIKKIISFKLKVLHFIVKILISPFNEKSTKLIFDFVRNLGIGGSLILAGILISNNPDYSSFMSDQSSSSWGKWLIIVGYTLLFINGVTYSLIISDILVKESYNHFDIEPKRAHRKSIRSAFIFTYIIVFTPAAQTLGDYYDNYINQEKTTKSQRALNNYARAHKNWTINATAPKYIEFSSLISLHEYGVIHWIEETNNSGIIKIISESKFFKNQVSQAKKLYENEGIPYSDYCDYIDHTVTNISIELEIINSKKSAYDSFPILRFIKKASDMAPQNETPVSLRTMTNVLDHARKEKAEVCSIQQEKNQQAAASTR